MDISSGSAALPSGKHAKQANGVAAAVAAAKRGKSAKISDVSQAKKAPLFNNGKSKRISPKQNVRELKNKKNTCNSVTPAMFESDDEAGQYYFWHGLFQARKAFGSLPSSLRDDEVLLLNHIYYMFIGNSIWMKEHTKFLSAALYFLEFDRKTVATLDAIVDDYKALGGEGLVSLVSQLDILLRSPEPTKAHAVGVLNAIMSPEFISQDFAAMEALAAAGDPSFAVVLALSYDRKKGENPEFGKLSVKHYLQAVNPAESPIAAMQLGAKYLRGDGVKQNNVLAYRWYSGAAFLNNPIAQHKLGYFYDEGLPGACEPDVHEAVKWYSLAGDLMPDSMHNLAKTFEDGRNLPGSDLEHNMFQAQALYSIAAARGFTFSQVNLGRMFLLGEDGIPHDREAGRHLLTMAAESGDCDAQLVVGMIHATPAFECYDLALAEYWLKLSLEGGKEGAEKSLQRVQQQMQNLNIESIQGNVAPYSTTPEAGKQRGDDFRNHDLYEAAAIEYKKAYEQSKSHVNWFLDHICMLNELELYEECLVTSISILSSIDSKGVNVFGADISRNAFAQIYAMADAEELEKYCKDDSIPPKAIGPKQRAGLELLGKMAACVTANEPEKKNSSSKKGGGCGSSDMAGCGDDASEPCEIFDIETLYGILAGSLIEVNACNSLAVEFLDAVFLREHKEALLTGVLREALGQGHFALKAAALLLRVCIDEGDSQRLVLDLGGVPMFLSFLDRFLIPIDSSESGSSGFNGMKRSALNSLEALVEITPLQSQKLFVGLYSLAHLVNNKRSAWLLANCDGIDKLVHFCCSSVAYEGKNDALNVVIQILGRVIAFSGQKIWSQLLQSGMEYAFACVFLVALNDIEKQILTKSESKTNPFSPSAVEKEAKEKEEEPSAAAKAIVQPDDEEDTELLAGMLILPPDLNVRSQLAPEIHFLENEPSFFLIAELLATLGLILKVCPDEFTLLVADSDVMPILQTVFRLHILTADMRAACAYCLCKLLCAKDPEAAKIIQDGLCENSLPNIFDDSVGGGPADPRSFMQFKHRISFVGVDSTDESGGDEQASSKLMDQMCKHKDLFNGVPGGAPSNNGIGESKKEATAAAKGVRAAGENVSI